MCRSVLPAAERIGVSTSSTPRRAKKSRISALSCARSAIAARTFAASRMVLLQESGQPCLVPDLDAEFVGLVELGTGSFARHHERGLLRHRTRDLGPERFQLL